jgi:hypothetical protein
VIEAASIPFIPAKAGIHLFGSGSPLEPVLGPAEGWTRVRGRTEFRRYEPQDVMAGHSRPKDGVLSHAYVPAIHVCMQEVVDARDKRGHDDLEAIQSLNCP